jgi:hypothetical protein
VQYLQNNIWMVVMAVTSGLMLFWSIFGNRIRGIKEVNSAEALQLINHKNALILDVREDSEYKMDSAGQAGATHRRAGALS